MKVLLAMDSFKGCATSLCVEQMMAEALRVLGQEVRLMPMSDGGDGMLDSFADAMGADRRSVETTDPLGRPIMAQYQTLMGKLPWRVMERARELGRQTWLVSGLVREREALEGADFGGIWQLKPEGMSTEEAMRLDVLKINIERWCDVVNECHLPH